MGYHASLPPRRSVGLNGSALVRFHQTGAPCALKKTTQGALGLSRYHCACVGPVRSADHSGKPGGRQRRWYVATPAADVALTANPWPDPSLRLAPNVPDRAGPPSTLTDSPSGA